MNKKALAILGAIFLLIVGTLGFLIFAKYGKKNATDSGTQATSTPVTETPVYVPPVTTSTPVTTGNDVHLLSTDQVVAPILCFQPTNGDPKKCDVAYFDNQGNLYQALFGKDTAGNLQLERKSSLTIQKKASISRILWPNPDSNNQVSNDFIAEFNFGGHKTWSYFNAKTGTWTDLPPQVESVDWLPGGKQIVYVWLDNGKASLNVGNPDATGWQFLADMYETDDVISVSPDGKNILFYRQYNTSESNTISLTSNDAKLWSSMDKDGYNYGVLWNPDGTKFLYGKKDPSTQKYQLWVYDVFRRVPNSLGVFTIPSKAVWSKDGSTVFASVPHAGIADENTPTSDDFYKIDVSSFEKKQYPVDQSVDGRNLLLTQDEARLLFRNGQDGGLYYLDLNQ